MISCPKCEGKTRVLETRSIPDRGIKRRRMCLLCAHRFNTLEALLEGKPIEQAMEPGKRGRKPKKWKNLGDKDHDRRLKEWQERQEPICDVCNEVIRALSKQVTRYSQGLHYTFCSQEHFEQFFQEEDDV